jgi:hypothetical protein
MFCKRRHYKNPTCFGHYSMTIFRVRPSFLVHLLPSSCLLRHLSFLGLWPYALYLYVSGVPICALSGRDSRPDNTQTGTPDTHTNRGHTATNPKKTNDEAGG